MAARAITAEEIVIGGVVRTIFVDEGLRRAMRRMEAAGMRGEAAWRAATLDLAIRRTMGEPT